MIRALFIGLVWFVLLSCSRSFIDDEYQDGGDVEDVDDTGFVERQDLTREEICDLYPESLPKAPENESVFMTGDTFPCVKFPTAMLNGEEVDFDMADIFYDYITGYSDETAILFFITAGGCPYCEKLGAALVAKADEIRDENIIMVGMMRRTFSDLSLIVDIDLSRKYFQHNGWLEEEWYLIDDFGTIFDPWMYEYAFPAVVIVQVPEMVIMSHVPGAFRATDEGADNILNLIRRTN